METNLTIRDYLCREAARLSAHSLAATSGAAAWERQRPERLSRYLQTLGITDVVSGERPPLEVHITGTVDRPGYRIHNLHFESLPDLHVTGSLYVPKGATADAPAPAIVYFCGHAPSPRVYYQAHPRRLAQLGFVVLVLDTIMFGEVNGVHHGLYNRGWWQWTSRGYNPAAIEVIGGIRGLDLLESRPEVDNDRIGVTGISGGGGMSWWVAAADQRVKALAAVCGTGTDASHVSGRALDGQCDCLVYPNTDGWDFADVYALVAPRPALIGAAIYDDSYAPAGVHEVHKKLAALYEALGAQKQLELVETPGPHSYHERSRTAIFSFLLKHLQGRDVPPSEVGDIDESPSVTEPPEVFRVYQGAPPTPNRVESIQDEFIPVAEPPTINDAAGLEQTRDKVIRELRSRTFAAFADEAARLETELDWEWAFGGPRRVQRIAFTSEPGWRLQMQANWPKRHDPGAAPAVPALAILRNPEEPRWQGEGFVAPFNKHHGQEWLHAFVETRGIGETAWGRDLHWHVRRALPLLGRTVASLRVYDTLRALQALRELPGVDGTRIALAGRGEMAAVALYAALLDGGVRSVILSDPPATQDTPGQPDGSGSALEMLQCLRITDLPQVAGLLWPAELVLVGETPKTYAWAEALYARLGRPGRLQHVADLGGWEPSAVEQST